MAVCFAFFSEVCFFVNYVAFSCYFYFRELFHNRKLIALKRVFSGNHFLKKKSYVIVSLMI